MKVFTYSEARQNLSKILVLAQSEEIAIKRKDGAVFSLKMKEQSTSSPFDVVGIKTTATTQDILEAVKNSRAVDTISEA
ncbi:prevent-host-death protein [Achromatium sp. WMS3]|nr:prevent-host-death protein [Achromatium sp. WMS3]